jgi:hypothetical protein
MSNLWLYGSTSADRLVLVIWRIFLSVLVGI